MPVKKKVVAIAQARMGSTRLPGKVMMPLGGQPVLQWVIDALKKVKEIDEVVLATSTLPQDDVISDYCLDSGIICFRGSEADVLDRFYNCALQRKAEVVVRVTCDCPFLDSNVIAEVVRLREIADVGYASNIDPPSYPDGLDIECFTFDALTAAWREASRCSDRDCVPQFIVRNRSRFGSVNLRCPLPRLEKERWVLDTAEDYKFCCELMSYLPRSFHYLDILRVLDCFPDLRKINGAGIRNERFFEAVNTEKLPPRTFENSNALSKRTMERVPFGAQTFSKSYLQFPPGRSPLYASHADGARIFDVDGNDYVDLVNAILPVVLGYRDPEVDEAIRRQLDSGISFSLATELEAEHAELMAKHIPCAEMTKLGKSGTDVTTAAIRLARHYTKRNRVILTGYHGWADWSMCVTDRDAGIPASTKQYSDRLQYGDFDRFNANLGDDVAAVIVEADDNPGFLRWLRMMCDKFGIVLIFDEVITGFRYSMGGAQRYWDVTPDLATFGKAMANGMPLAALCGRKSIMSTMSPPDNIFYSGTMFGETLSIAASIATIKKLDREKVPIHLRRIGAEIYVEVDRLIAKHDLDRVIGLYGQHPRMMIDFKEIKGATSNQLKSLFMQQMIQNGVLVINSHNVSFAMGQAEINRVISAYDATLGVMAETLKNGDIADRIGTENLYIWPLRKQ